MRSEIRLPHPRDRARPLFLHRQCVRRRAARTTRDWFASTAFDHLCGKGSLLVPARTIDRIIIRRANRAEVRDFAIRGRLKQFQFGGSQYRRRGHFDLPSIARIVVWYASEGKQTAEMSHVALTVKDLERTVAFYRDVVGITEHGECIIA